MPDYLKYKLGAWTTILKLKVLLLESDELPIYLNDAFLLEVTKFNNKYYTLYLKSNGSSIKIEEPTNVKKVLDYSICLISTQSSIYDELLQISLDFYKNNKIFLAYYGTNIIESCNVLYYHDEFHMAQARNRALNMVSTDYTLFIDTGILIDPTDIQVLIDSPSEIINIKNTHISGNGNYFGKTSLLRYNQYNERFKKFWYEDTEYLLNFSRIGIVPEIIILPYKEKEHIKLNNRTDNNKNIFMDILCNGR